MFHATSWSSEQMTRKTEFGKDLKKVIFCSKQKEKLKSKILKMEIDIFSLEQREITKEIPLGRMVEEKQSGKAGKKFKYIIVIPNVEKEPSKNIGNDKRIPFWLRIFANQAIDVEEIPETITLEQPGEWTREMAGGKLKGKKG